LVIGRSGATTVAELCVAGIGALYVPLPWAAEDHQTANAQAVARVGGAVVLPQTTTTSADIAGWLTLFARDRHRVAAIGQRALTLARPRAANDVAALVDRCANARSQRFTSKRAEARQRFQRQLQRVTP
jgi:UDP-N-acetylglucosamine--N-acetylmuramyl-(pentapeptide) pyrophosphoryl-undecaprenol N-acetylglucosamine transferase